MITIICVGKIKEKYFENAIKEYLKRLSKYTKLKIIEIEDYSTNNPKVDLIKEKDKIIKQINEKDYVIALEIKGIELTSSELSKKIDSKLMSHANLTFIIGGSSGLSEEIYRNESISFSKLTFPHQLFRVILLEQIYRSFKILKNETYHK